MSHWIVSISEDCAQQVTPDAATPQDHRFVNVEADSAADAFRLAGYTRKDLEAKEPAEEVIPPAPKGPLVKIVQTDMFALQGALFGHITQPGELQ